MSETSEGSRVMNETSVNMMKHADKRATVRRKPSLIENGMARTQPRGYTATMVKTNKLNQLEVGDRQTCQNRHRENSGAHNVSPIRSPSISLPALSLPVLLPAPDTRIDIGMGKHARKKQKTSGLAEVQPLGVVADDADTTVKDQEELRLESFLFGTTNFPTPSEDYNVFVDDDGELGGG